MTSMNEFGEFLNNKKVFATIQERLLFIVPLVYAIVMCFSLSNEWFPADDKQELIFVRNVSSNWVLFGVDVFGLFRPIKNLLFSLFNHMIPLIGIIGCRIVGIAIGTLSFFPILALCRRIFTKDWKALATASIWLLSPTLVSSVAWPSAINIQFMVAFAALAIVFHDDAWNASERWISQIIFASAFLFLSLVSYECAISVLPILILFDWLLRPGRIKNPRIWFAHAFYAMIVVAYLLARGLFKASMHVSGSFAEVEKWQLIVSSPFFMGQHFLSWFWPFGRFTVFGSYKWGQTSWTVLVFCAVLFVSILAFAIAERKRLPILSFCILFALLSFAPVSNCLGIGNGPYGDYYLSLASIGLSAGCIELCDLFLRTKGTLRYFALAVVVAFATIRLLSVPEAARWASWWKSGEKAYAASIRHYPSYFYNKVAAAALLFDAGRQDEALALGDEVEKAVGENAQQMTSIHLFRALHAMQMERDADKALEEIEKSIRTAAPGRALANAHYYRGCVFEDLKGDDSTAEKEYEIALAGRWDVDSVPCADRLARLKAIRGERDTAIAIWEKAARLDPKNESVQWNLALARKMTGERYNQ